MPFNPLMWAIGYTSKKIADKGLDAFTGDELTENLKKAAKDWKKTLPESYQIEPEVFFLLPDRDDMDLERFPHRSKLYDKLLSTQIPSSDIWFNAFIEHRDERQKTLNDDAHIFLKTDSKLIDPYLKDLADKFYNACVQTSCLFKSTVIDQLSNEREKEFSFQIPTRPNNFTGRGDEVEHLTTNLKPGKIITLCGPGGMGKSAIAYEVIHQLTSSGIKKPQQFPDGVLWHNFYGQPNADQVLDDIARSLNEDPGNSPYDAAKRALSGKRLLILLDGTEVCDDLNKVISLLGNCGVIVTTQKNSDASSTAIDIKSFKLDDSIKLLKAIIQNNDDSEDDNISKICSCIDNFPFAVKLVGKYITHSKESIPEYLKWLKETPLDALDHGKRRVDSVNVLLKKSIAQLNENSKMILPITGLLTLNSFGRDTIQAVLPDIEIRKNLNELVNYGIINRDDGRFKISHALIHIYIKKFLRPSNESINLIVEYYKNFIKENNAKNIDGFKLLDKEKLHILNIFNICSEKSQWENIDKLAWEFTNYLDLQGHRKEQIFVLKQGLQSSKSLNSRHDESYLLNNLGNAYRSLGQVENAIGYYKQALEISREIGNRKGEGSYLGNLGIAYANLNQVGKAINYYKQALKISRDVGDRQSEGSHFGNLGLAYTNLNQVEKAIEYYNQALEICKEIGNRKGESADLGNLGLAYRSLGQEEKAIEYHKQALEISREIGDRQAESSHLGNLGIAYTKLNQVKKAIKYYKQALEISREIGDRQSESNHLANLGITYKILFAETVLKMLE